MSERNESKTNGPSYLRLLKTGELTRRVEELETLLEGCTVCRLFRHTRRTLAKSHRSLARGAREIFFSEIVICAASIARTIRFHRRTRSKLRMKSRTSVWLR